MNDLLILRFQTPQPMDVIFNHRSVRKYKDTPVSEAVIGKILEAAARASTTGNMQLYSIVVTTSAEGRERLAPCHFNQPMALQAPLMLTFCADINRFGQWCELRGAEPGYDNFLWFLNAMTDALLAAQNAALEAESHGLGICFLGTAVYTADKIVDVLGLPKGVIPVAALVAGYPEELPPLTGRLPLEAVVHYEQYKDYTPEQIDALWRERENSDETARLLHENQLPNLAQIFTLRRYMKQDNLAFSERYFELLKKQGFFNQ